MLPMRHQSMGEAFCYPMLKWLKLADSFHINCAVFAPDYKRIQACTQIPLFSTKRKDRNPTYPPTTIPKPPPASISCNMELFSTRNISIHHQLIGLKLRLNILS